MITKYEQLESDIVNLFLTKTDSETYVNNQVFDISPLPDNESEYRPQLPRPQVYVLYNDSDFSENDMLSIVKQDEKIKIGIEIHSKSRRGEKGSMSIFETIRKTLIGYKFQGYDKITLIQFSPLPNTGPGQWSYFALFSTSTRIAECLPDPDEQGNILKQANFVQL